MPPCYLREVQGQQVPPRCGGCVLLKTVPNDDAVNEFTNWWAGRCRGACSSVFIVDLMRLFPAAGAAYVRGLECADRMRRFYRNQRRVPLYCLLAKTVEDEPTQDQREEVIEWIALSEVRALVIQPNVLNVATPGEQAQSLLDVLPSRWLVDPVVDRF